MVGMERYGGGNQLNIIEYHTHFLQVVQFMFMLYGMLNSA